MDDRSKVGGHKWEAIEKKWTSPTNCYTSFMCWLLSSALIMALDFSLARKWNAINFWGVLNGVSDFWPIFDVLKGIQSQVNFSHKLYLKLWRKTNNSVYVLNHIHISPSSKDHSWIQILCSKDRDEIIGRLWIWQIPKDLRTSEDVCLSHSHETGALNSIEWTASEVGRENCEEIRFGSRGIRSFTSSSSMTSLPQNIIS
jgi:hypothetical protein